MGDPLLHGRQRAAIERLNLQLPASGREEVYKQALRSISPNLLDNNEHFHRLLTEGIDVKFSVGEGKSRNDKAWVVDFEHVEWNEFLAANQVTVAESNLNKRPDIVLFINGLPLMLDDFFGARTRGFARRTRPENRFRGF